MTEIRRNGYVIKREDAEGKSILTESFREEVFKQIEELKKEIENIKSAIKKIEDKRLVNKVEQSKQSK